MNIKSSDKLRGIINRYPQIFKHRQLDKNTYLGISESIDIDNYDNLLISFDEDIINYIFLHLIIHSNKKGGIFVIGAYRLIDIYLGNDEEYSSIAEACERNTMIHLGYIDIENKKLEELVIQATEYLKLNNKSCWVLHYGNIKEKYPTLYNHYSNNYYSISTKKTINTEKNKQTKVSRSNEEVF